MFVLCPHCQFLVGIDPVSGHPPVRCTRCRKLLAPQAEAPSRDVPPHGAPDAGDDAPVAAPVAGDETIGASHADEVVEPDVPGTAAGQTLDPEPEQEQEQEQQQEQEQEQEQETESKREPEPDLPTASTPAPTATRARSRGRAQAPAGSPAAASPRSRNRAKPRKTREAAAVAAPEPETAAVAAGIAPAPGFVHRQRARIARTSHTQRWMVAAIAVLSALLVLQLLLAERASLARDARWRPAMAALCGVLRCSLPAWHEPTAFTLLDRDVRTRPGMSGVLRVTATFRNDARWPQAWPALLLTLSDLDGRPAGARVFIPREYLGAAPAQTTLASGQSAMLSMDVMEPAPGIVAFTFDFR